MIKSSLLKKKWNKRLKLLKSVKSLSLLLLKSIKLLQKLRQHLLQNLTLKNQKKKKLMVKVMKPKLQKLKK